MATIPSGVPPVQHVAGDLLLDELRVRFIVIEGLDDVIAVAPGVVADAVVLEAVAFGKAGLVEPVPRPPFAVVRGGQQSIDHLFVGVGRIVLEKGVDLVRRRRQADQIKGHAAEESRLVGGRRRLQAAALPARRGRKRRWGCAPIPCP